MDQMKQIFRLFFLGVKDSFVGILSVKHFYSEHPMVRVPSRSSHRRSNTSKQKTASDLGKNLFLCFGLNGVAFGLTSCAFYYFLLPGLRHLTQMTIDGPVADSVWQWLYPILSYTFSALWVLPLFLLSRVLNCFWFQDIADVAFEMACGPRNFNLSLSYVIADMVCSVVVQFLFMFQSSLVALFPIPYVGHTLSLLHLCLLYSLYAFEYKWIKMGWPLHKRLAFIDYSWPYFLGFGLPLATLTLSTSSAIANICIFSVLFPLYVIAGTTSTPAVGDFMFRLHIFDPVTYCSNFITGKLLKRRVI